MHKLKAYQTSTKNQFVSQYSQTILKTISVIQNGRTVQKCSIGKYQYSKQDKLGQGFSSVVYKATLIKNKKQRFAMKVIDLTKFEENQIELLETEIDVIRGMNHPNLIKCTDVYKTQVNYFLVTQYCPHGDLSELIKLQRSITQDKVIPIMRQILEGYKYLLSKNIIHRDLKPANIMRFGSDWKIGDFGFAKCCKQQFILQKLYVGTPLYMPPQSLQLNKYSYKSDIFALGVILYEMLTGQTPWVAKNQKQLLDSMKQTKLVIPPGIVSQQIKQFLKKTLQIDYYDRMNKQQLKKFTLENVDVQKVAKIRPGRGVSPGTMRQLSKSGKQSFVFVTPIKSTKNGPYNYSAGGRLNQISAIQQKHTYDKKTFNLMDQMMQLQNSPIDTKVFKQNADIMSNQSDLVKVMMNFVHEITLLKLKEEDQNYLSLFMYRLGLKILKMLCSSRQNSYRFSKWENFKRSEKYLTCVSIINSNASKLQNQFQQFKNKLQNSFIQKFNVEFPQLIATTSLNFKIFAKIYQKLRIFSKQAIVNYPIDVDQQKTAHYCFEIKQLINILKAIKSKTTRQQQIMGFGLKVKPQTLFLKNVSWSAEALKLSLVQLEIICSQKVETQ